MKTISALPLTLMKNDYSVVSDAKEEQPRPQRGLPREKPLVITLYAKSDLSDENKEISDEDDDSVASAPRGKRCKQKQKVIRSPKKRRSLKKSMVHDTLLKEEKGLVCLSIDVETACARIGIVQLSVVALYRI
jgi:hypothetical protein